MYRGDTGKKGTPGGANAGSEKNSNLTSEARGAKSGVSLGGAKRRPNSAARSHGSSWGGYK